MTPQDFAKQNCVDPTEFTAVLDFIDKNTTLTKESKMDCMRFLVRDQFMSSELTEEQRTFFNDIVNSELFSSYYSNWGKYRRAATKELNVKGTFETVSYFNRLANDVETLIAARPNVPDKIKEDAQKLKELINQTVSILIANDGIISTEEFDSFFGMLYGIYEGMLSLIGRVERGGADAQFLLFFRDRTKDKAFREAILNPKDKFDVIKGMFSLGTHLAITAQNNPQYENDCLNLIQNNISLIIDFIKTGDKSIVEKAIF